MNFDGLIQRINKALEDRGIFVDNIEYVKKDKYNFLEIVLDKVGGINLDEIVEVTSIINQIVDEEDSIKEKYILDISSKERG